MYRFCAAAISIVLLTASASAVAAEPVTAEARSAALDHFKKARELYQNGEYKHARDELVEARKLDPNAKDLVLNLGTVSERLQEYDAALTYLHEYQELSDVTESERQKVEGIIKRVEGAKKNAAPKTVAPQVIVKTVTVPTDPAAPSYGRIDAFNITTGILALGAAATAGTFGVLALGARPAEGTQTSATYPYKSLQDDTNRAHTFAVVADVGLVVAAVATVATVVLYFARTKDSKAPPASLGQTAFRFP